MARLYDMNLARCAPPPSAQLAHAKWNGWAHAGCHPHARQQSAVVRVAKSLPACWASRGECGTGAGL